MIKILIDLVFNNKKIKDLDGEIWIQEILLKEKFDRKNIKFFQHK